MADLPGYLITCLNSEKLALLAILVSGGIVLQVLVSFKHLLPALDVEINRLSDLPGYLITCLNSGKLALLAILVSGGIVLQVLACVLYNNWWPMLTALMYVILPVPLILFAGSDTSALFAASENSWVDATKFLTGASTVGSIAIPIILKHAGMITWGAFAMELSSLFAFAIAIFCFIGMNSDDGGYYSMI